MGEAWGSHFITFSGKAPLPSWCLPLPKLAVRHQEDLGSEPGMALAAQQLSSCTLGLACPVATLL